MYTQHPQTYQSAFSGQHPNGAPTMIYVPTVQEQKGGGVTQYCDQEDEEVDKSKQQGGLKYFASWQRAVFINYFARDSANHRI